MSDPLSLLLQRHSVPSSQLGEPAPDKATLHALLKAAVRVPDHGKLVPFRLIKLKGKSKQRFGEQVADIAIRKDADMSDARLDKERRRYTFAPLVLVLVACIDKHSKVPAIEQQMTAGCVAQNILIGAYALGIGAQWLTGWAAYDPDVAALLKLKENEHVIAFIHMGTAQIDVPDRDRPALKGLLSTWKP
ncbi:nitroreductase [Rhodanobacter sp. A1T4]|jgi:nitroreductase|uniref:nitroreductase family protein n=1 Tax=Rhodanobacter sp. A1T4 TaxID=2723087 RepID=UPI00161F550C|nr:nitroreductase [Rhodanobacter sp. A1T4]MBB6246164.1 nitroreductase [Rhodanobacter sp. A1T4]